MRLVLKIVSVIGLMATIIPSIMVLNDMITLENNKLIMMFGTILWFISAPFWMNKKVGE